MKTLQNNPQFKAFASSIDYGIIIGSKEGNILDFNEAALKIFGYSEEELRDAPLSIIIPKRFRQQHEAGMKRYNETQIPKNLGKTLRMFGLHKNGREVPIEIHLSSWHNTEGEQFFTASIRQYSALENNLSWILASSAAATLSLVSVVGYLILTF